MEMELNLRTVDSRTIKMNQRDLTTLRCGPGSMVRLQDTATGMVAVGVAEAAPEANTGEILVDQTIIDSLGSSDGMSVEVTPYTGQPVVVEKVTFGVKPMGNVQEDDTLIMAREWGPSLLRYIEGMVVAPGQRFRWSEKKINMIVSIMETQPPISSENIGILRKASIKDEYRFKLMTEEPPFNGILLLDMSTSMNQEDMGIRSIHSAIEYIATELKNPQTRQFLESFRNANKISRWRGAVLSALMYLVAKVARGKGEKISIILFSDNPQRLIYNNQVAFDAASGGSVAPYAQALIDSVNRMERNATFMSRALDDALNVIRDQKDPKKMKMIVMLTDGYPNDPDELVQVVKDKLAPRMDVVLFVAGIGEHVNEALMLEITSLCGGEYLHVTDLDTLVEWYRELARKLTIRGKKS